MIEKKRENTTEEEIRKLCDEVTDALVLWDDVFSKANTKYESTAADWVKTHCDEMEESIKLAMHQMRSMGFSITPKMHGLECHIVHLMRTIPGGIRQMIEHWVEQYHQQAAEMERLWVGHPYKSQAEFRARREKMLGLKETMTAGARLIDSKRKVKRKREDATVDEKNRIKEGRKAVKQRIKERMDSARDIEAVEDSMDTDGDIWAL